MMDRFFGMALVVVLSCACKSARLDCLPQVRELRRRVTSIDWSTVNLSANVAFADIPVGDGMLIAGDGLADGDWSAPVIVDGSVVWYSNRSHGNEASLDEWLYVQGDYFHDEKSRWPFYVLATHGTRVGLIRRVEKILRPLGDVRLAVRPATVAEPWLPRPDRKAYYSEKTRPLSSQEDRERDHGLGMAVVEAAQGCPEAVVVATQPWPAVTTGERLLGVPDAFEKCSCKGDMDTMAALLWFMTFEGQVPIRWHAWDEELIRSVGDDATYAELAKVLTERYLATKKR